MTDAELKKIERACGCSIDHSTGHVGECDVPALLTEVRRLRGEVAAEREACALLAIEEAGEDYYAEPVGQAIAAAIRARR